MRNGGETEGDGNIAWGGRGRHAGWHLSYGRAGGREALAVSLGRVGWAAPSCWTLHPPRSPPAVCHSSTTPAPLLLDVTSITFAPLLLDDTHPLHPSHLLHLPTHCSRSATIPRVLLLISRPVTRLNSAVPPHTVESSSTRHGSVHTPHPSQCLQSS